MLQMRGIIRRGVSHLIKRGERLFGRLQTGELGSPSIPVTVPDGWLLDDEGNSITQTAFAPSDVAALLLGLGVATLDLSCNHNSFTLNNLIACLIATDILQVEPHHSSLVPRNT